MIRKATIKDIKGIESLGEKFYNEAEFSKKGLGLDVSTFGILVTQLLDYPSVLILVVEKDNKIIGTIGGVISPWLLDTNQKILQELWWYIDPEYRGIGHRLIVKFEKEAVKLGANFVLMVTLDSKHEDKLITYYNKMGYNHLEHHFIKKVL